MADKSKIEWTEATWNPLRGCSRVSEGCRHCYAEGIAARFSGLGEAYEGLAKMVTLPSGAKEARWTGEVRLIEDHLLDPLRWKRPRRIFVNSMSDLFHEKVPDEWIDRIFAVMALADHHRYQILTKRPERMKAYIEAKRRMAPQWVHLPSEGGSVLLPYEGGWPTYIWLGVSAEDQATADERIPLLLDTPAAVRFVSLEPLLGPIDLYNGDPDPRLGGHQATRTYIGDWWEAGDPRGALSRHGLDWVIVGGESGRQARPMHPDWARSLRDQCTAAGVPFFFKQWGDWGPDDGPPLSGADRIMEGRARCAWRTGLAWHLEESGYDVPLDEAPDREWVYRLGKKAAGRELDGRTWDEMPR